MTYVNTCDVCGRRLETPKRRWARWTVETCGSHECDVQAAVEEVERRKEWYDEMRADAGGRKGPFSHGVTPRCSRR